MSHECGHTDDQHDAYLTHLRDQVSTIIRNWVDTLPDRHRDRLPRIADLVCFFAGSDTMWHSDDPKVLKLAYRLDSTDVQLMATIAAALGKACGHTEHTYFTEQHERGSGVQGFVVANLFASPNVSDSLLHLNEWITRRMDAEEIAILGDMVSGAALALRYGVDELRALFK